MKAANKVLLPTSRWQGVHFKELKASTAKPSYKSDAFVIVVVDELDGSLKLHLLAMMCDYASTLKY